MAAAHRLRPPPLAVVAVLASHWALYSPVAAWSIAEHGWISVAKQGDRHAMVDESGRQMLMRGINIGLQAWEVPGKDRPMDAASYANGKCPPNKPKQYRQPPLCGVEAGKGKYNQSINATSGNDLAQIRALGFNVVRLGITWSLIEPTPGNYSASYFGRIEQVVNWAREQDLRVIIDMHQDFYSYSLDPSGSDNGGYTDGAPYWAVLNKSIDDVPLYKRLPFDLIHFDWKPPAAFAAFFRNDVPPNSTLGWGIQEHYIRAVAAVAKLFTDDPVILGFEIMNEPQPTTDRIFTFSDDDLYPFYKRVIQAVTGVRDGLADCPSNQPVGTNCAFPDLGVRDTRHIMFFEPMAARNQLDFSVQRSRPFTEFPNIVFCPHQYTFSFTLRIADWNYKRALRTAWNEANQMNAAVLVSEYGGDPAREDIVKNIALQQDLQFTSSTFWTWKEHGGGWSMWVGSQGQPGHMLSPKSMPVLSRARPQAVQGQVSALAYDADCGRLSMTAVALPGAKVPSLVYVPPHLNGDGKHTETTVSGAATLGKVAVQPDGSQEIDIMPNAAGGEYSVLVLGSDCRKLDEHHLAGSTAAAAAGSAVYI